MAAPFRVRASSAATSNKPLFAPVDTSKKIDEEENSSESDSPLTPVEAYYPSENKDKPAEEESVENKTNNNDNNTNKTEQTVQEEP